MNCNRMGCACIICFKIEIMFLTNNDLIDLIILEKRF